MWEIVLVIDLRYNMVGVDNLVKQATNLSPFFLSTFLPSSVAFLIISTHLSFSFHSLLNRLNKGCSSKCFTIHSCRSLTSVMVYTIPPSFKTYAYSLSKVLVIIPVSYTHLDVYKRQECIPFGPQPCLPRSSQRLE